MALTTNRIRKYSNRYSCTYLQIPGLRYTYILSWVFLISSILYLRLRMQTKFRNAEMIDVLKCFVFENHMIEEGKLCLVNLHPLLPKNSTF